MVIKKEKENYLVNFNKKEKILRKNFVKKYFKRIKKKTCKDWKSSVYSILL